MSEDSGARQPGATPDDGGRNGLGEEKSPYLLQHRDNPVWWRPWGSEAFGTAKREDKPIFLSVGYSTCHWCHVMAHESFEDPSVASVLNAHYVPVKVDREERPDVDDLYMTAVQGMTGRGGWPMSVWLTPEGRPFFAGTYFPRDHFRDLLGRLAAAWRDDRERIEQVGRNVAEAISQRHVAARSASLGEDTLRLYHRQFLSAFDGATGGRAGAPKFPPTWDLRLLLRIHRRTGDPEPLAMARTTLDAMARGGIFDHLAGGFHRYSTDDRWLVPHFEKMLYDQASLAGAYTEAWQATGEAEYELVAREVLDYVLAGMTHPDGGFFSAEDADSEGEEGRFYVWTAAELGDALEPDELPPVVAAFGVSERGNFEHGTNILNLQPGHTRRERSGALSAAMKKLRAIRDRRVRPQLDDKVLTSWNGLMISSLALAARAFDDPRYLEAAARAAKFVLRNLRDGEGRLLARWREGEARFPAYVDDYAFLIEGLIELYQAGFDVGWLDEARRLQTLQEDLFADPETGGYWFSDGSDGTLLSRGGRVFDNVTPAAGSVSAHNLLKLAGLCADNAFAERAAKVFSSVADLAAKAPAGFPRLLMALDHSLDRSKEIAIVGKPGDPATRSLVRSVRQGFNPNTVVALAGWDTGAAASGDGSQRSRAAALLEGKDAIEGRPTAYVCEHGACSPPTDDPARTAALVSTMNRYILGTGGTAGGGAG